MRLALGWRPWVLAPLTLGLVGLVAGFAWMPAAYVGAALLLASGAIALFFRDPDREAGPGIVSAADGRVRAVGPDAIVTFLNVHDVHVVRAPYAGDVTRVHRFQGGHKPAFLDGSEHNAGLVVSIDTAWGVHDVHLLVGLVARRAVAYVEPGDSVEKGDRIGMIRLGSRVDVDLPSGSHPAVDRGEKVHAGASTIAHPPIDDPEGPA